MKKILIGLITMLMSLSTFAAINQDEALYAIKGKYQISMGPSTKASFVIRSSGEILMLKSQGELEDSEGTLAFVGSSNSNGPDGLPVVSLVFSTGSDEETRDIHVLMTVEQDWSEDDREIKLITVFSTFNYGPNEYSSYEGQSDIEQKKYNKKTKKYELIK